jgi:hypothetical protein
LGIRRYQVKEVFPPKADGHYISGFSVVGENGKVSKVGTGYSRQQQKEIKERWETGKPLYVLVDCQTLTQYGVMRHASFQGFSEE